MRCALIAAILPAAAAAQFLVDPAQVPEQLRRIDSTAGEPPIGCSVTPLRPMLNFGFRFQSGYLVRIPMGQYAGKGHAWYFASRITPEGRNAVWLAGTVKLPNVPPTNLQAEQGGVYQLGEGRYHVAWKMTDDSGRSCRKEWDIDARLGRRERTIKVDLEPGSVVDLTGRGAGRGLAIKDDAAPIRLTVLLHAAPILPRRMTLGPHDRGLLLGALSALLERVPVRSVRLVVFNLDQHKEIYRRDAFTPRSFRDVVQAMEGLQLFTVNYGVLREPRGHLDLLTELVNDELKSREPADAVVFIGPIARYTDSPPGDDLRVPPEGSPTRFFYLQCRPFSGMMPALLADSISRVVARLKGKTILIYRPEDLAKAIAQVERE